MSLESQRTGVGLSTPIPKEKLFLWEQMQVPGAEITPSGRTPFYIPSPSFTQAHFHPARERIIAGGVRGGKSLATGLECAAWALHANLIWIVAVDYSVCRMEFSYAKEALLSIGFTKPSWISQPADRYKPCVMETLTGCKIETRTLSDLGKVAAHAPDVIFVCEPGLISNFEEALQRFRERLTQKRGLLWMAGTFEDSVGEYAQLWELGQTWPNDDDLASFSAPTWENTIVYPGGRNDPEILILEQKLGVARFQERCGGIPTPPISLVFHGRWDPQTHFRRGLDYNDELPIELAVDPNYGQGRHYSVEFVQWDDQAQEILVIDEVAATGMTHDQIIKLCALRPYWHRITGGVLDPYAGRSHIFGSASPEEIWWKEARIVLRTQHRPQVENAIERMNFFLSDSEGKPHIFFSDRCKRAKFEMEHWRRNKLTGRPSDDNCDAVKALCYWLVDHYSARPLRGLESVREYDFEVCPA